MDLEPKLKVECSFNLIMGHVNFLISIVNFIDWKW